MFEALALVLTLIASAPATLAAPNAGASSQGGVRIYNACDFPVYSTTVTSSGGPESTIKLASGWNFQAYLHPSQGGPSLKLTKEPSMANGPPHTQLEYTFSDGMIFYDVSNVNCGPTSQTNKGPCPFLDGGVFLHTSNNCDSKTCHSGDIRCHDAYNLPNDDWATAGCKFTNQNVVLYVCKDKPSKGQ